MSRKKTTLWNMFFFYLRNVIAFVNGILIIPIYLKFIDNNLYGAWLATGNILTWLTIVDPGVGDVLTQKVSAAMGQKNRNTIRFLIPSALIISTIVSIIAFILSLFLSNNIEEILNLPSYINNEELSRAFNLNAISTCITLFSFSLSGSILGFQKTKEIGIILTSTGIIAIIFNIILIYNGFGLISIAYSNLLKSVLSAAIFGLLLFTIVRKEKITFSMNKRYFKSFSKLFTYTFFSKLFSTIANNIDLIIVSRIIGPASVTILELSRRPMKVMQGFINIPSISLLPAFANLFGERDYDKIKALIKRFTIVLIWILLLCISGFITFNKDMISLWVGIQNYVGDINNLLIGITFLFATFTYNLSNFTYSMGNIKGNSVVDIIRNLIYLTALYFLGKYFGITGIIIASILSILLTEIWYYPYIMIKKIKLSQSDLKENGFEILKSITISLFLCLIFFQFSTLTWAGLIIKAIIFTLAYILFQYLLSSVFKKELTQIFKLKGLKK